LQQGRKQRRLDRLRAFALRFFMAMKVWTMLSSLKLDKIALFFSTTSAVFFSKQTVFSSHNKSASAKFQRNHGA
jgi:hypothetical protein